MRSAQAWLEAIASIVFFETHLCPSSGESVKHRENRNGFDKKTNKINHCISGLSLNNKRQDNAWLFVSRVYEAGQTGSRVAGCFNSQASQVSDAVSCSPPPPRNHVYLSCCGKAAAVQEMGKRGAWGFFPFPYWGGKAKWHQNGKPFFIFGR